MVGTTWKSMSPQDKAPYERVATDELERYMDAKRTFEALHRHYSTLHYGAQEAGVCACCTATSWTAFSCTGTTARCTTARRKQVCVHAAPQHLGQHFPSLALQHAALWGSRCLPLTFISIESLILFSRGTAPALQHAARWRAGRRYPPFSLLPFGVVDAVQVYAAEADNSAQRHGQGSIREELLCCGANVCSDYHAGYLDEHGTPRDFATRPNGGTAILLSLTQVQRAMAKIGSMEKQKHLAPARSSAPKRPRARSPSPELDISDDDEPEGVQQCLLVASPAVLHPILKQLY